MNAFSLQERKSEEKKEISPKKDGKKDKSKPRAAINKAKIKP